MLRYVSLFSGIGSFEQGFNPFGFVCVFASEILAPAIQCYRTLYGITPNGNIREINARNIPNHTVLVAGFPCQTFTVFGKQHGFQDTTKGTLFFEVVRVAEEKQPAIILIENVKGLVNHDKGRTLEIMVRELNRIGYAVDFEIINSHHYVPQNRERVYIVASREAVHEDWNLGGSSTLVNEVKKRLQGLGVRSFNFPYPKKAEIPLRLHDILEEDVPSSFDIRYPDYIQLDEIQPSDQPKILTYTIPEIVKVRKYPVDIPKLQNLLRTHKQKANLSNPAMASLLGTPATQVEHWFRTDNYFSIPPAEIWLELKQLLGIQMTEFDDGVMVFEEREGTFEKSERAYHSNGLAPTLMRNPCGEKIIHNGRLRRLTLLETFRLQGFSDEVALKLMSLPITEDKLYRLVGGTVTVPVVQALAQAVKQYLECPPSITKYQQLSFDF